jgi:hypothetical protein
MKNIGMINMKTYLEWKKDKNTKTITITCRDSEDTLEELLEYIKKVGNMGHTFMIVVDPDAKGGKKFEWDGDGSDAIFDIKTEKSGLHLQFDVEGEPVEV